MMYRSTLNLFVITILSLAPLTRGADAAPTTQAALDAIGKWDGKTESAALEGPYEDRLQQEVPFGRRSFYLSPWRAYMDTWPASTYLNCLGVNLNCSDEETEAVAKILGEVGVRSARVEIGWGSFQYDDPGSMPADQVARLTARLQMLQKNGIRPIMLLNAHHGVPCPLKFWNTTATADAAVGSRTLKIKDTKDIIPFYTGPGGFTDYKAAECIITKVNLETGECELSKPLPKAIKSGDQLSMTTLKYQPISGMVFEDGTPNPAAQETLDGWKKYVAGICRYTKEALAAGAKEGDVGFDLEVWNEYTFGSHFLSDTNYYDPPRKYKTPVSYTNYGRTQTGPEVLLPITVDYANDPVNALQGVNVLSGFTNQSPWGNGVDMWPGQAGYSRHYYTGVNLKPLTPDNEPYQNSGPVNALGGVDGKSDGKDWHTVIPGTFFIPTLIVSMPERSFFCYQTETMTRDSQPFPGPWPKHYRYGHPGTGREAQVWQTEFNFDRGGWAEGLIKETGVTKDDPKLLDLMHHTATKATLRTFVFQSHKGITTINLFAVKGEDASLSIIDQKFYGLLKEDKNELTDRVRAAAGLQIEMLNRMTKFMRASEPIREARPLNVEKLVEHRPRVVFKGDGTPEHPDRFNRDDFACLPYQLGPGKFAVAYYVVTRNMVHDWQPEKDLLDPERYNMPEQMFDLTLSNVHGTSVKLSIWDPITDQTSPLTAAEPSETALTARVPTVDYPRFLIIEESQPGPLVTEPKLKLNADGSAVVSFATNIEATAKVTWGPLPDRSRDGSMELPVARTFSVNIPKLRTGAGVQITVSGNGLTARLPRWGYDSAGVNWGGPSTVDGKANDDFHQQFLDQAGIAATATPTTNPSLVTDLRLPPLAASDRPIPEFKDDVIHHPESVEILSKGVKGGESVVLDMFPDVSTVDQQEMRVVEMFSGQAICADFKLNPIAHPGLTQTRQIFYIMRGADGYLVISMKGPDAAVAGLKPEFEEFLRKNK